MDTLGFIPSDVMCLPDGTPVGAFMRLDRGDEPTDHHTLVRRIGARVEGRSRRFRGRRPGRGRNGPAGDDGAQVPSRLGRRATSPRQPDLRLLARSVGPEARALRGRRSVRRPAAGRLSRARSRRALSVGPRPSGRLHRRQTHAAAARLGPEDGHDRQAASQEDARAQEQRRRSLRVLGDDRQASLPEVEGGTEDGGQKPIRHRRDRSRSAD